MEFDQFNGGDNGFFKATEDDKEVGLMTYSWKGNDKIVIQHTEVDPAFSGKGIGKQLVMEMVKFARENGIKVIPICPFTKSVFNKVEAIRDVLL